MTVYIPPIYDGILHHKGITNCNTCQFILRQNQSAVRSCLLKTEFANEHFGVLFF